MPSNIDVATSKFEELQNVRRRRLVVWIVVGVLFTCVTWAIATAGYKASGLLAAVTSPASTQFLSQAVLSVLLGVVSAIAYGAFENRTYKAALARLYNAGPVELVDEAIALLEHYRGTLVFGYEVEYHLSPSETPGLLNLRVKFSYRKLLSERDLYFRVMRLKTVEDLHDFEINQASVDALYAKSELFFYVDEVELREKYGEEAVEKSFAFEYLKISGVKVTPAHIPTDRNTLHAPVPHNHDLKQPISLEYCFRYAVSTSDIVFCLAEYPTRGVEVRFTRDGALSANVSVFACELMSATVGNATITEDSPGTHLVSHPGWVLPKSGAVFHWYPSD